jgi:hypothetical protein
MDTIVRIAVILALIAFSLFRLIRYFRHGVAKRVTALPPSAGMLLTETPSEARAFAPATSGVAESRSGRFMAGLITLILCVRGSGAQIESWRGGGSGVFVRGELAVLGQLTASTLPGGG